MNAKEYDVAVLQYTAALSLNPTTLQDLLGKRSKAHAGKGEWEDALGDANEITRFNSFELLHTHRRYSASQARSVLSVGLCEEV